MGRFAKIREKGNKIFVESGLSDEFSHIGKSKMLSIVDSVTTLRSVFKVVSVYPCDGGGHHTEIKMIRDGMRVPGLTFSAADFLFDFFETGFDFPPGAIVMIRSTDKSKSVVTRATQFDFR